MRTIKSIWCLAAIMMATMFSVLNVSCSKDEEAPEIKIPTGSEDFFSKSMDFDNSASEKKLTFSSNKPWTVTVSDTRAGSSWLSVSPTSGDAGTQTLTVRAEENTTYDDRNAVISVVAGDSVRRVFVNQKQLDALTLTSDRFEVPVEGGTVNIEVKSNIDYNAVIPTEYQSWIHLSKSTTRGLSTSSLSFTIDKSDEYDKREGKIIIKSKDKEETVSIYQAGDGILTLTQNVYDISSSAQELSIEISSNFDYTVDMPDVDWIKEVTSQTRGLSSHTLRLAISENEDYEGRSAKLRIYDKNSALSEEVTINQSQKNALIIDNKEYEFDEKGGSFTVEINSNVEYTVNINCDWIKEKKSSTRSLEKSTREFVVSEITENSDRVGTITFTNANTGLSEDVSVKQNRTLYFDVDNLTMMEGSVETLHLTNKSIQEIVWSSSNESVVTVDNTGKVKAVGKGTATVYAKTADQAHTCKCEVTVQDITDFISASSLGGSISIINGLIQYGSKLNWNFMNYSKETVHLKSLQLIDGGTGSEGNEMAVDVDVAGGTGVSYTVTIGLLGIHGPVTCRFRYTYNNKDYYVDAVYNVSVW